MTPFKVLFSLSLATVATASFPPAPEDIIVKEIDNVPGASISYKETFICETKAKAYAGYVNMPASYLADIQGEDSYNVSTFFWYFRARKSPTKAPTAIYLAGGPGESSIYGVTSDDGPCYVLEDSNSTVINPDSWNENVNMLYVDQPLTTGFSYSEAIESTLNLLWDGSDGALSPIVPLEAYNGSVPAENSTLLHGTLPDQNPAHTANSSTIAARTLWHFSQLWFAEFPEHRTRDDRISLAGNSYGGFWVSTSMAHFQRQNEKIEAGEIDGICLHLDTAVITNGEIDLLYQAEWSPMMAYNNTYGFEAISKVAYEEALNNFTKPDGCRDLIEQCRDLGDLYDPEEVSLNETVNELCLSASRYCFEYVFGAYSASNRSHFDMAIELPSPSPPVSQIKCTSHRKPRKPNTLHRPTRPAGPTAPGSNKLSGPASTSPKTPTSPKPSSTATYLAAPASKMSNSCSPAASKWPSFTATATTAVHGSAQRSSALPRTGPAPMPTRKQVTKKST